MAIIGRESWPAAFLVRVLAIFKAGEKINFERRSVLCPQAQFRVSWCWGDRANENFPISSQAALFCVAEDAACRWRKSLTTRGQPAFFRRPAVRSGRF